MPRIREQRIRPALRASLKWGTAIITLVITIVYAASVWRSLLVALPSGLGFGVYPGLVWIGRENRSRPEVEFHRSTGGMHWWFRNERGAGWWFFGVPLWAVQVPAVLVSVVLWRRDSIVRRRAGSDPCSACGYDLAGLAPAAVCPECGMAQPLR